MKNLFQDIPAELPDEWIETLAEAQNVRIERIVSRGHASPEDFWYDQDEHEWVCVLSGHAVLAFEDGDSARLGPGDHLTIPAHRKHRVASTSRDEPTVWLCVFFSGT